MLEVSAGATQSRSRSGPSKEPVCESGRTLKFLVQRSVAFAACLRSKLQPVDRKPRWRAREGMSGSLSASPSRRQKERLCRY